MKDFDKERLERHAERAELLGDRDFLFGGEKFTFRANPSYRAIREISAITVETPGNQVYPIVEQTIRNLIEPEDDAFERFERVCTSQSDPVTNQDIRELMAWLISMSTETPTLAPSLSTDGGAPTKTALTGISSSPPAEASAA